MSKVSAPLARYHPNLTIDVTDEELENMILERKWAMKIAVKNTSVGRDVINYYDAILLKDYVAKYKPDLYDKYKLLMEDNESKV